MRLGADPEVFLQDQSGKFISSIGRVGGSKSHPFAIPGMPNGYTLQEDNVAVEFGIPPASTANEFVDHINKVVKAGLARLPGLQFSKLSCVVFPEDQMQTPEAFVFGCEPDFDAWNKCVNEKPAPPHPYMRSAGGHVHIETTLDPINVVRACDLFLGVPSVLMDKGEERRKLYGKAGAFRPKPYGVEYRTLSNFWIFDESLIRWVWRNTKRALQDAKENIVMGHDYIKAVQECINNGDKKLARKLIKGYNLECL